MKTVPAVQVVTAEDAAQEPLPPRVQEALGQLVGAAKEGLLALSVGVGLGVLAELMEQEVDEVVGPKSKHDPDRIAVRHGHEGGEVTLGGRRVAVKRPRVRSADGEAEVALSTYQHFADRDPLSRLVLEQMLAGVSTRRFQRTREPVGTEVEASARCTSKSSVSRDFVAKTTEQLIGLMSRRLDDIRLAALMLDGIELKGRCCVVALGIATDGVKIPLGLWDGSTENATVAKELLSNLVARGLDLHQGVLCVIDGSKALRKSIDEVLGPVPVQRCIRHKERNVLHHLAERDRPAVKQRLRSAWKLDDHAVAPQRLRAYLAEVLAMVEADLAFDVLAHLDYPKRYWPHQQLPFVESDFEGEYRSVLGALARSDRALEVNTSRGMEPRRGLCPGPVVLRWWREEGGRSVCFGSDAHDPEGLMAGFEIAVEAAEAAGFRRGRDPLDPWSP